VSSKPARDTQSILERERDKEGEGRTGEEMEEGEREKGKEKEEGGRETCGGFFFLSLNHKGGKKKKLNPIKPVKTNNEKPQ